MIGAVMPKPDERPASLWNYYFRVANTDLAVEVIAASGGTLVIGPEEIPGGDFIVIGIDPQGALFFADRNPASAVLRPLFMARRPQREKTHEYLFLVYYDEKKCSSCRRMNGMR
ncbi:hypothetical protein ULF88_02745 [Halopseudomonas pachastrellae]|nr:hypothetical protein [Halopseudomonas pachastrellae]